MARILLFNPPLRENIYARTNVSVGVPHYPNLTLATLAGNLIKGHRVKIVDLDLLSDFYNVLFDEIRDFGPDIIASSAVTPNFLQVKEIMGRVKKTFPQIKTILGGVHVTALPEEASREDCFDIIAIGEGDTLISELLSSSVASVRGIIYTDSASGEKISTGKRELIQRLDESPYPAWELFDINKYKTSRLLSRRNPVGHIETSRGCVFECNFCSKLIFGSQFRAKEPKRVVDEMEYMLKCGFQEIHIADDSFTQDIYRAKEICNEIIRRKLKFPWSLVNGIRVNMVDFEFLKLARKSGCWQVCFGIESADQNVLNIINKKITVSQVERAIRLADKAGLDTLGLFMFGLSGEDEESIKRTINFAKRIPLDTAKFDICIPYPGTRYYEELDAQGSIISKDWSKYNFHKATVPLFKHQSLSWDKIAYYYRKAYREFYIRPAYLVRRLVRGLKNGDVFYDIPYFLRTKW